MDPSQIAVSAAGLLTIGMILWFFFGSKIATKAIGGEHGVQEVQVLVRGGYTPDRIEVKRGIPVRLTFLRQERNPCTEQVILSDFGISRSLPENERIDVEFTPNESGEYSFHCGMNMVRGKIVVV